MEKKVVNGPFDVADHPLEPGVLGYYRTETIIYHDDGVTPKYVLNVTRPILTDEECEKRYDVIKRAAVNLVLATEKAHAEKGLPPLSLD